MSEKIITAAILIIGDEILSGNTPDTNSSYIAKALAQKGIDVLEVRFIQDEESAIIFAVNELRAKYTYVLTTGGIGATHDDITAASIAKAFKVPLVKNPKAYAIIKNRYKERLNAHYRSMAFMPEGASLIANSLSDVPSFYINNVYVLAGMPSVMRVMLDDILPTLKSGEKVYTNDLTSKAQEDVIAESLSNIQAEFPKVSIGSYPFYDQNSKGTTLVLKSRDTDALKLATQKTLDMLRMHKHEPLVNFEIDIER